MAGSEDVRVRASTHDALHSTAGPAEKISAHLARDGNRWRPSGRCSAPSSGVCRARSIYKLAGNTRSNPAAGNSFPLGELPLVYAHREIHLSIATYCPQDPSHQRDWHRDRKSTRLNSSHGYISYAVFCLKKKKI